MSAPLWRSRSRWQEAAATASSWPSEKMQQTGSAVRDLGVFWYEMEIAEQAERGIEVDVHLFDQRRREVDLYRLESEAYGSYRATLTVESAPGALGAENTFVEFDDGAVGNRVRVFDDDGEFLVETNELDGRHGMAFMEGGDRIEVLRLDEDPGAESGARLEGALRLANVRRIDADPRLSLLGAISDDAGLADVYAHLGEDDHHAEHGKIVQEVHGTPLCGAILGTAGGACIACIAGALAAGTITAGTGTAVIGFLCGFACGFGAADLIACAWASVFAPNDAQCRLQAANNYPWTQGSADTTADVCVFTCDNGNCNAYCGTQKQGATGACVEGNICRCTNPPES